MTVSIVAAARPNFIKVAPVVASLTDRATTDLVHTGQHYDVAMSRAFFDDLGLREPDVNLGIGSGSHAEQTAGAMVAYEKHLTATRPAAVIVVGDVNSTLACALAAAKLCIPVAHVEAGLRSHDWSMPEEINRVLTDRLSHWLFTPSADADENLILEGIDPDRIHLVGNVMIDTLMRLLPEARKRFPDLAGRLDLATGAPFGVLTMHRPSNVDETADLAVLLKVLSAVSQRLPLVFPIHPRTRRRLAAAGLELGPGIIATEPLGYLDFLALLDASALVLTDSGGIQEETSILGVPCLTLRDGTERPVTCELGTNTVVGTDPDAITRSAYEALEREAEPAQIPFWDGRTAERIADVLAASLG